MKKKILIAGASGMIWGLILKNCLSSFEVKEIVSLVRKKSDNSNPKLKELVIQDFKNYEQHQDLFQDIDAAFFCIGVYTGQVKDDVFKEITVDFAVSFGEALKDNSPQATLCFLSGQGADRKEKSRTSFARYKGIAENRLIEMNLGNFHSFRPSYIYPVTPRKEPNAMYSFSRFIYPVFKLLGSNFSIQSDELANAMFKVAMKGTEKQILENKDILNVLDK